MMIWSEYAEFENEQEQFIKSVQMKKKALSQMKKKEAFFKKHKNGDPYFIDKYLEPIQFLQKEESMIRSFINHPACCARSQFENRLNFIQSGKNKLSFSETHLRMNETIKETEQKQRYPVQMDREDLQKICSLIENVPIGPYQPFCKMPQLMMTQFHMKRSTTEIHSKTYEVEIELLQREWLP
jgi:hypothetical protein